MTDQEKVKQVYPDASIEKVIYDVEVWQIRSRNLGLVLGEGDTEAEAWVDAASRLPQPVAAPQPVCPSCGSTEARITLRGWKCADDWHYADTVAAPQEEQPSAKQTWLSMSSIPKNASWFRLLVRRGGVEEEVRAHWAEDLSGSEQPPFRGLFREDQHGGFVGVVGTPIGWLPEPAAVPETPEDRWITKIAAEEDGSMVATGCPACPDCGSLIRHTLDCLDPWHDAEAAPPDDIGAAAKCERCKGTGKKPEIDWDERYKTMPKTMCACGEHEIAAAYDGIEWYWQHHGRIRCTLELPDIECWCGLKRSEHKKDGHKPGAVFAGKSEESNGK